MDNYILSETAKADLIRIHQYGLKIFGESQADKYFNQFFENFERISKNPYAFESVDYIRKGYRRCISGVDSIYFRVNETQEKVEIMAIIGRQDLEHIL